jgi:hypothetical protein
MLGHLHTRERNRRVHEVWDADGNGIDVLALAIQQPPAPPWPSQPIVTTPLAGHSVPRTKVATNPGVPVARMSLPSIVAKTRPAPYETVHMSGSSREGARSDGTQPALFRIARSSAKRCEWRTPRSGFRASRRSRFAPGRLVLSSDDECLGAIKIRRSLSIQPQRGGQPECRQKESHAGSDEASNQSRNRKRLDGYRAASTR